MTSLKEIGSYFLPEATLRWAWSFNHCHLHLSQSFIPMKRHHDMATLRKESITEVAHLQFRGLVHHHHGDKHGSAQADMVPET